MSSPSTTRIGGLPTLAITSAEFAKLMVGDCLTQRKSGRTLPAKLSICSNGQGIALAGTDPEFKALMDRADYIHADGMPLVLASRWLGKTRLPERIATTDFFHDAAAAAMKNGLSFYFLGGRDEENAGAVAAIRTRYPSLTIAGRHHGYFSKEQETRLLEDIRNRGTDVLWLGLGKPLQEKWAVRNQQALQGVGWIKTCGGLFSFLAGNAQRAPVWMQRCGLEWLFRLGQEPGRLWQRYLVTNPQALWFLLTRTGQECRLPPATPEDCKNDKDCRGHRDPSAPGSSGPPAGRHQRPDL